MQSHHNSTSQNWTWGVLLGATLGNCSTISGSKYSCLVRMEISDGVWMAVAVIFSFGAWSLAHAIWNTVKTIFALTVGVANVGTASVGTQTDQSLPSSQRSLHTSMMWCTAQGNKIHLYYTCHHLRGKATLPTKEGFCQSCLEKFESK